MIKYEPNKTEEPVWWSSKKRKKNISFRCWDLEFIWGRFQETLPLKNGMSEYQQYT